MIPIIECIPREMYIKNNKTYDLKQLVSGSYQIRISVITTAGNGLFSNYEYFDINDVTNRSRIIIFVMILLSTIIGLMICFYATLRIRLKTSVKKSEFVSLINSQYSAIAYVADEWEISRDDIQIICELGRGCFGVVYQGVFRTTSAKCAIKTVEENATYLQKKELLNEASIMKQFDCHHVVKLLGKIRIIFFSKNENIIFSKKLHVLIKLKIFCLKEDTLNFTIIETEKDNEYNAICLSFFFRTLQSKLRHYSSG